MLLRHSLNVMLSNYKLAIKVFFISAILSLIVIAIFTAILNPILQAVGADADFSEELSGATDRLIHGDVSILDDLFHRVEYVLGSTDINVAGALAGSIVMAFILKVLFAFMSVGAGYVMYNKMSTGCENGYLNAIVATFGKAVPYALIDGIVTVPVDLGMATGAYFLAKEMFAAMGLAGAMIAIFIFLLAITARISIVGQILPVMLTDNVGFFKAFSKGVKRGAKAFKHIYPALLVLVMCIFGIISATLVPTLGIIPIASLPVMLVAYDAVNLIASFRMDGKKYHIDERVLEPTIE